MKEEIEVSIVTHSEELPPMESRNFFHSPELFRIVEHTPGQRPFMVVARQEGTVVGHMLATLRRRGSLFPPYLFSQGRVYGEGEYADGIQKEPVFEAMLKAITHKLRRRMCLYIEFSDLKHKMFGYRILRREGYIPVQWMEVHNSLHSMLPEERITAKGLQRVETAQKAGVVCSEVTTDEEFRACYRTIKQFFSMKMRRYLPSERFFMLLRESRNARLFITRYKEKVIGGCACVYSGENAYLWYMASKRKTFRAEHPGTATVWGAIQHAHAHGFSHIYFMDVGLPFKKTPYRDFILSFGGKEVGTYRWFRISIGWLNTMLGWLYRE